ncbi:hypothetical protein ACFLY6_02080 [Candidatus Dependentiae bacterium]
MAKFAKILLFSASMLVMTRTSTAIIGALTKLQLNNLIILLCHDLHIEDSHLLTSTQNSSFTHISKNQQSVIEGLGSKFSHLVEQMDKIAHPQRLLTNLKGTDIDYLRRDFYKVASRYSNYLFDSYFSWIADTARLTFINQTDECFQRYLNLIHDILEQTIPQGLGKELQKIETGVRYQREMFLKSVNTNPHFTVAELYNLFVQPFTCLNEPGIGWGPELVILKHIFSEAQKQNSKPVVVVTGADHSANLIRMLKKLEGISIEKTFPMHRNVEHLLKYPFHSAASKIYPKHFISKKNLKKFLAQTID